MHNKKLVPNQYALEKPTPCHPFSSALNRHIFLYHLRPCISIKLLRRNNTYIETPFLAHSKDDGQFSCPYYAATFVLVNKFCRCKKKHLPRWWSSRKCFHLFVHQNLLETAFHAAECFVTSVHVDVLPMAQLPLAEIAGTEKIGNR